MSNNCKPPSSIVGGERQGMCLATTAYFPALDLQGKVYAQIVKSSPLGGSFGSYLLFLLSITSAQKSIHIANPYFFPDNRIEEALINAVKRGVKVVVLTPEKGDHATTSSASHSGLGPFLRGGVEIYEYHPALMHSKAMVVDGIWATVGSANLDYRSLAINEEINLVVYDAGFARAAREIFSGRFKVFQKVDLRSLEFALLCRKNPGTVLDPDKRTVMSQRLFCSTTCSLSGACKMGKGLLSPGAMEISLLSEATWSLPWWCPVITLVQGRRIS